MYVDYVYPMEFWFCREDLRIAQEISVHMVVFWRTGAFTLKTDIGHLGLQMWTFKIDLIWEKKMELCKEA